MVRCNSNTECLFVLGGVLHSVVADFSGLAVVLSSTIPTIVGLRLHWKEDVAAAHLVLEARLLAVRTTTPSGQQIPVSPTLIGARAMVRALRVVYSELKGLLWKRCGLGLGYLVACRTFQHPSGPLSCQPAFFGYHAFFLPTRCGLCSRLCILLTDGSLIWPGAFYHHNTQE